MSIIDEILRRLDALEQAIKRIEWGGGAKFYRPPSPLTSTAWDGDARSTTAKTLIDLSAVFGVPNGVKAVLVRIAANDSASAASNCFFGLDTTATADMYSVVCKPYGRPNDTIEHEQGVVPCNSDGDIYYQCTASGAGTLDVTLQILGWFK